MEERNDALQHYGVVGMKWGVRRDPSKAFQRAALKADRLERKATRYHLKSAKLQRKGVKKMARSLTPIGFRKGLKKQAKAAKYDLKSARLQRRGEYWAKAMKYTFQSVGKSEIKPSHLEAGKKYAYMLMDA